MGKPTSFLCPCSILLSDMVVCIMDSSEWTFMNVHIVLNEEWAFFEAKGGRLVKMWELVFIFIFLKIYFVKYLTFCLYVDIFQSNILLVFLKDYAMKKTPLEDNHWLTTQLSKTEHKLNYCTDISRPPRQKRDNWQKKEKSIKWLQKRLGARQSWGKRWFKFWTFFSYTKQIAYIFLSCPMTLQSATRKLKVKMRHSSRDMVTLTKFFFVHTILIRDHVRIF